MDSTPHPLHPDEAERRIIEELEAHGLPMFQTAYHDPEIDMLVVAWAHGPILLFDLTLGMIEPFDESVCQEIVSSGWSEVPAIDVSIPGSPNDPREEVSIPGVNIHYVPELHPDDVTTHKGIPVTTPSRTLIDLADVVGQDELREVFSRARDLGLLDPEALRESRARVEWRPSLRMLDEVIAEFCD